MNLLKAFTLNLKAYLKYFLNRGAFLRGNFSSWTNALNHSDSYADPEIFEKVKRSAQIAKKNKKLFEQDSILIDRIRYSLPSIAGLLYFAVKNNRKLTIVDFGGSLATVYFQYQKFLKKIKNLRWCIVEQAQFEKFGNKYLSEKKLSFYNNLDKCIKKEKPDVFFASSSLQYVDQPYDILKKVVSYKIDNILIDLTPFHEKKDTIKIQYNPNSIYKKSYPINILNEKKFIKFMIHNNYILLEKFETDRNIGNLTYKGFIFERKK